jgi:hypothetical protein
MWISREEVDPLGDEADEYYFLQQWLLVIG